MIKNIVFTRPAKVSFAFGNWAISGFPVTSEIEFNERKEICKSCDFWENAAFNNTGKCKKCGCSTLAKLKMKTEKCPIEKW